MKSRVRFVGCLVALGLMLPAALHATFVIYSYNVRAEWITYDFIGWVRVGEVLESPSPTRNSSKVRLKVIERLKGEKTSSLELVYPDEYVGPGREDQVISLGIEQRWREYVGEEYLAFLRKRPDGIYEADEGHYFLIKDGWLWGPPREYQEYFQVPMNPHITEFMAKVRAKEPRSEVRLWQPLLATPSRWIFGRRETPRERAELLFKALLENRTLEAEQMIYRTKSYGTPAFITHVATWQAELRKLKVVREAVYADHALTLLALEGDTGEPETWYWLREKSRWRLLSPEPLTPAESDEVEKLKRDEAFAVIKATLKKENSRR